MAQNNASATEQSPNRGYPEHRSLESVVDELFHTTDAGIHTVMGGMLARVRLSGGLDPTRRAAEEQALERAAELVASRSAAAMSNTLPESIPGNAPVSPAVAPFAGAAAIETSLVGVK